IQVTVIIRTLLGKWYRLKDRGEIQVKGKGSVTAHMLLVLLTAHMEPFDVHRNGATR
ncbi:MAG: hypothetical protein GY792_15445, partial [Gammaproteobacteria bacterium]|nr:hypothetical protein [Gammaproteobacteria bacterium]